MCSTSMGTKYLQLPAADLNYIQRCEGGSGYETNMLQSLLVTEGKVYTNKRQGLLEAYCYVLFIRKMSLS